MKGFKDYISEEGLHSRKWTGIYPSDIDDYVKKNDIFLYRNKKNPEIIYAVLNKGDKESIFTYDKDEYVMRSDYTPIDFRQGRIRKKIKEKQKGYFK